MVEVRKAEEFAKWVDSLRDLQARARIQARIERMVMGNMGDVKHAGGGISELRIDCGPGYRVYFKKLGKEFIILLAGGIKRTQSRDIRRARDLAKHMGG